jgi:integrator complex subunit 11
LLFEKICSTFIRDSKRIRETEFLARVHAAVERGGKGLLKYLFWLFNTFFWFSEEKKKNYDCWFADFGKVLIPVFALGRVQELCILIETYWQVS